jgi:sulfatase modifying factor 1
MVMNKNTCFFLLVLTSLSCSCKQKQDPIADARIADSIRSCMQTPARFSNMDSSASGITASGDTSNKGMVYIPGGNFSMGADNQQADKDEYPKHEVTLSPFWIDKTEVTNAEFQKFVNATGYITTAEKKPDWEEMKKTLPPGTPNHQMMNW